MKAFLVDDNPVALTMLSNALQAGGYETVTCDSGTEALERIPIERPLEIERANQLHPTLALHIPARSYRLALWPALT